MHTATAAAPATAACPSCEGPVDVKSRHVAVAGSSVRVYCSQECLQAFASGSVRRPITVLEYARPRAHLWPHVVGITIGVGLIALGRGGSVEGENPTAPSPKAIAAVAPPPGPTAEQQAEAAVVADLMQDAWFHPLAGPTRRMPRNHAQAFGAERPGVRAPECLSGHCGVDVGGGLWGEPVHAAHAGEVVRVNRGPNDENGGVYVKLAHRDGTVFTWYFHLAAVPRWIQPGVKVDAGQVIGLLGDTGVKTSAPHLHFSMSVKPTATAPERYLDPEPLIAIWPLWVKDANGAQRISTHEPPGLPARAPARRKLAPSPPARRTAAKAAPSPAPAAATAAAPVSAPSEIEPVATP